MLKKDREKIVQELVDDLKNFNIVYLVDFQGLNVEEITTLRKDFRKNGVKFRVVKNTLLRIAQDRLENNLLDSSILLGSSALVLAKDDPISPAKTIREFLKKHDKPQIKGIIVDDSFFGAEKYEEFSKLPSVDELRARMIGSIKAPLNGIVFVLSGLLRGFLSQLDQIREQKAAEK
ncbi:50S ribosomal protein L10 [bacterium]|nr:50S ribosomal protein L10 [bacterium]